MNLSNERPPEVVTIPLVTLNKVMSILSTLPFNQVAEVISEVHKNTMPINGGPAVDPPSIPQDDD